MTTPDHLIGDRVRARTRTVTRFEIDTGQDYDGFRTRYEAAVPAWDAERTYGLVAESAGWDRIVELADENAPLGFMIYWRLDAQPLLGLAGDHARCTEYLMGNHVIAERMFRHDAGALLHAPLRTAVYEDRHGRVLFATERPSDVFGVFDDPRIDEVGRELDDKLRALLAHLDLPMPDDLAPDPGDVAP